MKIYRKNLIWSLKTECKRCGHEHWCKTESDQTSDLQGLCEACSQQVLDEVVNLMENSEIAHMIDDLKAMICKH